MKARVDAINAEAGDDMSKGWRTVVGGILLHFVIGTMYNWGNIITYVTSYLRLYDPSVTYTETMKVYPIALATHGVTLLFSGWISRRIGYRNCCLLGSFVFVCGTLLASMSTSFDEILVTQGIMFGMGMGLTYTVPISSAVQWLPQQQGVVSGLIVAGFGCGPFIFGSLSSYLANPNHLSIDHEGNNASYFPADSEVVLNVPYMFRSLGAIYFFVMLCGSMLIEEPPTTAIEGSTKALKPEAQSKRSSGNNHRTTVSSDYSPLHRYNQQNSNSDEISNTPADNTSVEINQGPFEMLQSSLGWHVALCLALTSVGGLYLSVSFKVFAQEYFSSDLFLTMVASTASLFNALGRILWGYISDRMGPLSTLIAMSAMFTVIIWCYPATASVGQPLFAFWTFLVFFFEGSNFVIYIPLCIQCFGRVHATSNYALLFLVVPIFNLINIFLLADLGISFSFATSFLAITVFFGCICLMLLSIHMKQLRIK